MRSICIIASLVLALGCLRAAPADTVYTLLPQADTYVDDGPVADTNYGGEGNLLCRSAGPGYDEEILIRFDLSTIVGSVTSAILKLHMLWSDTAHVGTKIDVFTMTEDTWDEMTITYNMLPPPTNQVITSFFTVGQGEDNLIDITQAAQAEMAGDKKFSMEIISTGGGWIEYGSKEQSTPANRPALICTVDETSIKPLKRRLARSSPSLAFATSPGRTHINFRVENPGRFEMTIRDLAGQRIWCRSEIAKSAGFRQISWIANASQGIYVVTLSTGSVRTSRRLVLMQ